MPHRNQTKFYTLLFIISFIALANSKTFPTLTKVVVFGDSTSDNGNVYKLTKHAWPLPSYFEGRFSNGKVWNEYLASQLNSSKSPVVLMNRAYGGATTDSSAIQGYTGPSSNISVPGVLQQVKEFLKGNSQKTNFNKTLFSLNAGGNDLFFTEFKAKSSDIVSRLGKSVKTLIDEGAQYFLLLKSPHLENLPSVRSLKKPAFSKLAKQRASSFNIYLSKLIKNLTGTYKVTIQVIDIYSPAVFSSLKNQTTPCLNTTTQKACSDPDSHLWWDSIHFTTKAHKAIGELAWKLTQK